MKHEWSKMSPRDRDKLIAEKVMELKDVRYEETNYIDPVLVYGHEALGGSGSLVPNYSTSMWDVWKVVDKLITEGFSLNLGSVYTETLPAAICKAAMLAYGEELE